MANGAAETLREEAAQAQALTGPLLVSPGCRFDRR